MKTYAIMHNPLHQRAYKDDAAKMALHELIVTGAAGREASPVAKAFNPRKSGADDTQIAPVRTSLPPLGILNPRKEIIGGVAYFLVDVENSLTARDMQVLSRLTFVYALFEYKENQLAPLEKNPDYFLDESLSSLLKYTGKTNEIFTRLMLHLAVGTTQARGGDSLGSVCGEAVQRGEGHHPPLPSSLRILDPLAGKGTTLFEALIHHHHAYGVEIDPKTPAEADQYLKKFLELARFKHTSHKDKVHAATRYQITAARDKEAQKTGDTRQFEIINGDTRQIQLYYKKDFFHAVVADLPYGVQHASKKPQTKGFTRNALGLLGEALPGWHRVLKPGGAIVLAWNCFLISRAEMEDMLIKNDFIVNDNIPDFTHRVDQAIERDVIVAHKLT
jgi:SAM-dependent methyltransferase